jgi:hypothetical protein
LCEEVPRQKAAESRKIPESGSVIPREGVESSSMAMAALSVIYVIPREGVESYAGSTLILRTQKLAVIPREGVESSINSSYSPSFFLLCVT